MANFSFALNFKGWMIHEVPNLSDQISHHWKGDHFISSLSLYFLALHLYLYTPFIFATCYMLQGTCYRVHATGYMIQGTWYMKMIHEDDHDDLYIIGAVFLYDTKMLTFRIQRFLLFLLFVDTFRIQDIWSFLLFTDTTFQKVSRNSKTTKSLEIRNFQGIW